jgi:hypothetical protein
VVLSRISLDDQTTTISLKDNPKAFISTLQSRVWVTAIDSSVGVFKPTFSNDSGVLELTNDGTIRNLKSWAVASGVLKIDRDVILEARISKNFFVGLNKRDRFIIFRGKEDAKGLSLTDLKSEREAFFNQLLTGEWVTGGRRNLTKRFRPIFGELAGKVISTKDDKLYRQKNWEYSPATGALKVGHTEYLRALIVNNTLALLERDGDQTFYSRSLSSSEKRYTLSDVKKTALNENSLDKVQAMLGLQTYRNEYFFLWEFNPGGRTGFLHQWKSEPFSITGETLSSEGIGKRNTLRQVEEFLVFDEDEVFQLDATVSRLRPKTDTEAEADAEKAIKAKTTALQTQLKVRVSMNNGKTIEVELPLTDFSEIASISLVTE